MSGDIDSAIRTTAFEGMMIFWQMGASGVAFPIFSAALPEGFSSRLQDAHARGAKALADAQRETWAICELPSDLKGAMGLDA